jgi:hypothetical protein
MGQKWLDYSGLKAQSSSSLQRELEVPAAQLEVSATQMRHSKIFDGD